MNKAIPFIYFALAAIWLAHGIRDFIQPSDTYYLGFGFKTSSAYGYLAFKIIIGVFLILAGIRRMKMSGDKSA